MRRGPYQAAAILAIVALAGCGSTVRGQQQETSQAVEQSSPAGLAVPGGATTGSMVPGSVGVPPTATGTGVTRPTATGGVGPTAPGSPASGGTASTTPGATTPAAGGPSGGTDPQVTAPPGAPPGQPVAPAVATGRGFDETTVNIGMGRNDDAMGFLDALGISVGESTVDAEAAVEVVIADINATGGIGGRQVNLVIHQNNTSDVAFSPDVAAQAACATWTEDNQVFAVTRSGAVYAEQLNACLSEQDTPLLFPGGLQGLNAFYQDYYDRYPLYINIGAMEAGRYDRISVRRLVERAFFEPWDTVNGGPASDEALAPMKLAIVAPQGEYGDRQVESIAAELAKYAIAFSEINRSSGRLENQPSEASSQVLQFRSAGITHVFGVDIAFQTAAESQGYRPRYFFPYALGTIALTSPAEQLHGMMGESILPAQDTSEATYPGHPSPAYDHCLAVLAAAGIEPSTNLDHWIMQGLCDSFYPLRDAIAASGVLSNEGLLNGLAALGDRPVASVTWTSQFTDRQHASAIALRDMTFNDECTCFAYDSDINHFDE